MLTSCFHLGCLMSFRCRCKALRCFHLTLSSNWVAQVRTSQGSLLDQFSACSFAHLRWDKLSRSKRPDRSSRQLRQRERLPAVSLLAFCITAHWNLAVATKIKGILFETMGFLEQTGFPERSWPSWLEFLVKTLQTIFVTLAVCFQFLSRTWRQLYCWKKLQETWWGLDV